MAKKGFMKAAAFLLFSMGLVAGTYAQVTISGGFALSNMTAKASGGGGTSSIEGDVGLGANVYLDYMLPIGVPLSLGAEIGIDSSSLSWEGVSTGKDTVLAIPLLIRAGYHFDLFPKLDLYLVGKIGFAFGSWSGSTKDAIKADGGTMDDPSGFAFGIDIGAAYYFTSSIGVFGEVGFDDYALSTSLSGTYFSGITLDVPFNRFFTAGISAKF
jgi:hypothetical protein